MNYAYIRQPKFKAEIPQLIKLKVDSTFTDIAQLSDANWPQLKELLSILKPGDVVHVESMDRISKSIKHFAKVVGKITAAGAELQIKDTKQIIKPGDAFIKSLNKLAALETSLSKERESEVRVGRKPSLTDAQIREAKASIKDGVPIARVARMFKVSRQTLYNYLEIYN